MSTTIDSIGRHVYPIDTWSPQSAESDEEFDYIDIASIDREGKSIGYTTRIRGTDAPSRARQIVRESDLLVSTVRPNLNAVAVVPQHLSNAIASTGFCVLRSNPKTLNYRYLFHWVRSNRFINAMVRQATGASYPAVSDRIIKASSIPLPPLPEQKRIADILDVADAIRRKRREASGLIQHMPLATFRETFSRYLRLDAPHAMLRDVAEIVSGVTKGRRLNGSETKLVPYLRVANVQAGYLDLSEIKMIPATDSEIDALALRHGDVVMTEGGDHDKLGRGALWEDAISDCIHQNHVFRVRTDRTRLLPSVLVSYLQTESAKGYFLRCAKKTSNLASINMTELRALPVPLPPLKLQERFDKELATIANVVQRHEDAENEADNLFHSLAQRAFHGEL